MMFRSIMVAASIAASGLSAAAMAAPTPRQILMDAAFQTRDKPAALARIAEADKAAEALLAHNGLDREAGFVRAMALGYHAKLTRSRSDAMAARRLFEGFAASDPRDPEAAAAVGTWHLDSVLDLGGMVARMALGAHKATGLAMMDRAVALGGNRATYAGLAALLRLALDPGDARGRALAEKASISATTSGIDKIMQRNAIFILASLRAGDADATQKLARQMLPFGKVVR